MKQASTEQDFTAHERLLLDKEQRYLSLIYHFLDGRMDAVVFRHRFLSRWGEERDKLWQEAQGSTCHDFRPLVRLFDRLDAACSTHSKRDDLRLQVLNLRDEYQAAKVGDPSSVLTGPPPLPLFERPLPSGWVYPCTLDNIRQHLAAVPEQDLEGLLAVGLVPPKREDRRYHGTYWYWSWRTKTPVIHLYAWPISLSFKAKRHYSVGEAAQCFAVELSYGMRTERVGGRLLCRWETECLRRYVAEHVLLHEIGHHVQRPQRLRVGFSAFPGHTASEQFADDYALRGGRRGRPCRDARW